MEATGLRESIELTAGSSNTIYPDPEQRIARALISEAEDQINILNNEIIRVQRLLDSLEDRRTQEVARLNKLRIVIAPHKTLPPELLSQIFVDCVGGNEVRIPPNKSTAMLWRLGLTCSRWRKISFSESRLWDKFFICGLPPYSKTSEITHYILSQIGNFPINFRIGEYPSQDKTFVLDLFSRYSNRIRGLSFWVANSISKHLYTASYPSNNLESLTMTVFDKIETSQYTPIISALSAHGHLQRLKLMGSLIHGWNHVKFDKIWVDSMSSFWAHLRSLTIGDGAYISHAALATILQHCTRLVYCDAVLVEVNDSYQMPSSSRTMEHLRRFAIDTRCSCATLGSLLDFLICPELKVLDFRTSRTSDNLWPEVNLLNFISRSPGIQVLQFKQFPISDYGFRWLICGLPALVTFDVKTLTPIPETALDTIRRENLVPHLEAMDVWVASSRGISELLESRWPALPGTQGLSNIVIRISAQHYHVEKDQFEALTSHLIKTGRRVQLVVLGDRIW
ncbi:hypothetical protein BDZ94DRAFT_812733 [Collybia nuda]|uniref:F-box domain-containing protein n=1 Tax=Collybia nuda TaxID=64659 RepID=A0A9P6CD68_9AGAR|nr:hypothetical protein BDZ94DRAFT_812733 [Collybia nuda]